MLVLKSTHTEKVNALWREKEVLLHQIRRRAYLANFVDTLEKIVLGEDLVVVEKRHLDEKTYFLCYSKWNRHESYQYREYVKMKSKKEAEKWESKVWNDEAVNSLLVEANDTINSLLKKLGKVEGNWNYNENEDYSIFFAKYNKAIENVIGND